jgi:ribosome-associated toxin RatA of RatAB toxin-antitoxin module
MKSLLAIEMAAPPQRVFELARDISRWPQLLPHYRSVTVESHNGAKVLAQMVATRHVGPLPLPVTWRAEQWSDPADAADLRLHFRHVRGFTRGMEVVWHIRAHDSGSRVSIEHDFSRRLPLLGSELLPAIVNRFFIRPIAGRTLATFKALAEEGG